MRRRALAAVPFMLVTAASALAVSSEPILPVPETAFSPVVIPELESTPEPTPAPPVVEPRRSQPPSRPEVATPEAKPKLVTPEPRPIPMDMVSGKHYGVVEGSRIARAYAKARLSLSNYHCLDKLWVHESGWRWNAENRSSGAYGIPQALPGSKMRSAGADWRTNPVTQVRWGMGYISGRYSDACSALSFWNAHGWY